jgi:hypothetical protein
MLGIKEQNDKCRTLRVYRRMRHLAYTAENPSLELGRAPLFGLLLRRSSM